MAIWISVGNAVTGPVAVDRLGVELLSGVPGETLGPEPPELGLVVWLDWVARDGVATG